MSGPQRLGRTIAALLAISWRASRPRGWSLAPGKDRVSSRANSRTISLPMPLFADALLLPLCRCPYYFRSQERPLFDLTSLKSPFPNSEFIFRQPEAVARLVWRGSCGAPRVARLVWRELGHAIPLSDSRVITTRFTMPAQPVCRKVLSPWVHEAALLLPRSLSRQETQEELNVMLFQRISIG